MFKTPIRVMSAKLGIHRKNPRVWLEGQYLLRAGFEPSCMIEADFAPGRVTLRLSEQGSRRVSQKGQGRPVIDINSPALRDAFGEVETLQIIVRAGEIVLTPVRSDARRAARCRNGLEGSVFSGGGLLSKAAELAGFRPGFAIEINSAYADCYERNFPEAAMFNMSVGDVPLDELPQVELLTIGIPCENFTNIRTITRDTREKRDRRAVPESQSIDGDLTMWAALIIERVNPATVIIEEAKEWIDTGAGWMMRFFLQRLGYVVEARVIDAVDFGELMHRRRTVMIATSDERVSWPQRSESTRTLGDIFDGAEAVESEWFDSAKKSWYFEHCRKQKEKGNGFAGVTLTADSKSVKGVTKRYLAGRGENSVIAHPTKNGVFRFFTLSELRKLFGVPSDFILPDAKTVAGEIICQGVIVSLFKKIIGAATAPAHSESDCVLELREDAGCLTMLTQQVRQLAFGF